MDNLMSFFESELYERKKELNEILIVLIDTRIHEKRLKILRKHFIPVIYSSWEGFLKNCIEEYVKYINKQNLNYLDLGWDKLAIIVKSNDQLKKSFDDHENIKKTLVDLHDLLKDPVMIEERPKIKKSLNFDSSNKLLLKYGLPTVDSKYKKDLDKLVHVRSFVAHGDNFNFNMGLGEIKSLIDLVKNLMDDFVILMASFLDYE